MALHWDTANVEDKDEVCWGPATADEPMYGIKEGDIVLNFVTNALIWHSLNTGIGTITEANAAEVYARIAFIEELHGVSCVAPNKRGKLVDRPITVEDVRKHIGLYTNASFKDESRASFLKRHATVKLDRAKFRYENETAKAEVS